MVKDISNHYHTKWIIIQSCKKTAYPILKLSKDIMTFQRLYISVFSWEDFLLTAEMKTEVRPLVLLTCWSCPVDCLYGIADLYKYSRFMWLMFGNLTEVMSMEGLHIPLNCFFILAEKSTLEGTSFKLFGPENTYNDGTCR
ncbi:UNVERIFIED_CONTAM: hypothetical protein PYX00_001056 [Menopon gallinae]|uniref:Uncharacterized protein n=1 Tax=Menopon gallinae TaxID=328185 RepID=A0AAW2IC75_9NEOP